jgi:hypothetical protein
MFACPVVRAASEPAPQAGTPEYKQQPSDSLFKARDGIGNVLKKLNEGGKVKIAYIGGSITAAQGWRIKSLEWFRKQYPQAEVEEICAALGGTGSDLGVYRLDREVLSKNPDLIFIEFARNNGGLKEKEVWETMEGLVRKLWKSNPRTDIIFVYCAVQSDQQKDWDNDLMPLHDSAADQVAAFYGIPSLNLGYGVTRLEREGKALCGPMRYSLAAKFGPDWWSEDWWFGWQTTCDWKTEARDHWVTFGFNGNAVRLFEKEPRARLRENEWQHLALTRKGPAFTLYLDGKAVAMETNVTTIRKPASNVFSKATGPLALGTLIPRGPHGELHALKGFMDETALFKGALDADTVRNLFEGRATFEAIAKSGIPLIAFWNMEEAHGSTLADCSGAKADGTLTSFGEKHKNIATNSWWSADVPPKLESSKHSLHFSGGHMKSRQGEHVEVPSLGMLDLDGDFTISLWVKPETLGLKETMIFVDTIHPIKSGHQVYTDFLVEMIKAMDGSKPVDHSAKLATCFIASNWEDAKVVPLEAKYLKGGWKQMDLNDPLIRRYLESVGNVWWASQTPGDSIHFKFKGAGFGTRDFTGPDAGQLILTVDGVQREAPVNRFLPWSREHAAVGWPSMQSGLDPAKVHEVVLEIHPEANRRGMWGPFKGGSIDEELKDPKFQGQWIRANALFIRGEMVD